MYVGASVLIEGLRWVADGRALQNLRALRHDPPGYAKQGARRTPFQASLNQCEQFLHGQSHEGALTHHDG